MEQMAVFAFVVVVFAVFGFASFRSYFLTKEILEIVREEDPAKASDLAISTGNALIDGMIWVRRRKFAEYLRSYESTGSRLLHSKIEQYKRNEQIAHLAFRVFALVVVVMILAFVLSSWLLVPSR